MSRALKSLAVFFAFVVIVTLSRHAIGTSTSTTTTTASGSSTGSTTTVPGSAACAASDFTGVFNQGQGAAGTIFASVTLTKQTGGTCSLRGWPRLALQDRTGALLTSSTIDLPTSNSPIQFPAAQANKAPSALTMHKGSTTTFALAYSDVPRGTETCAAAVTITIQLVSGGPVIDVTPQYPVQPCNRGSIWVSPFY